MVCSEHDIASYVPDPPWGLLPSTMRSLGAAARPRGRGHHPLVFGRHARRSQRSASQRPVVGGRLAVCDARISAVRASPAALWRVIEGIGGENGWYSFPAAWAVHGLLDRLAGGVGLRRGRRDPQHLLVGDALDFWRVEAITPDAAAAARRDAATRPGLARNGGQRTMTA